MERVTPLSKPIREALINLCCRPEVKYEAKESPGNKDCIVRLYLGRKRRSSERSRFFSLRNCPLHLDQALQICPDHVERLAEEMGAAPAVLHWLVKVDANDVEFVLGGCPTVSNFGGVSGKTLSILPIGTSTDTGTQYDNLAKRAIHLWIIDFDKCNFKTMDKAGVEQAIAAADVDDPYFPKPTPESKSDTVEYWLWRVFGDKYLSLSEKIPREDSEHKHLPADFLNGWAARREAELRRRDPARAEEELEG